MPPMIQEYFWTPDELIPWIRRVCGENQLWIVLWRVGSSAEIISPESISPSWFEGSGDYLHFFIGDPAVCPAPQWRFVRGTREIDFALSYAVQLVPSLMAPDGNTLLQGRLAILRPADYEDASRYAELRKFFRRLRSDLRRNSDSSHVVVQPLATGGRKRWSDMLVGPAVVHSKRNLKQFFEGEVRFELEPI